MTISEKVTKMARGRAVLRSQEGLRSRMTLVHK